MNDKSCTRGTSYKSVPENELDAVIESSYDGIVISNRGGIIERVNASYVRITGIKKEEIVGHKARDLVAQGVLSDYLTDRVVEVKQSVAMIQTYKTGKKAVIIGSPIFDPGGDVAKVVFNVRDITEVDLLRTQLNEKTALTQRYQKEVELLRSEQMEPEELVIHSSVMKKIIELVKTVARVDTTVLILGESGAGKGQIARAIHHLSARRKGPFIKVNCGAIPETLLESELFGYEKGAFSGARQEGKPGMFELAHRGTLLLDEIGELPMCLQVKLLQVLQEQEFIRVGGTRPVNVDVRIIATTNRNLKKRVAEGFFREDLFYRLNVVPMVISPLRDRPADIVPLVEHFLQKLAKRYGVKKTVTREAMDILLAYPWPGNVRELENIIERLVVTTTGTVICAADLPESLKIVLDEGIRVTVENFIPLKEAVEQVERQLITMAFQVYGNTYKVAEVLGISQPTAYRKVQRYLGGRICRTDLIQR